MRSKERTGGDGCYVIGTNRGKIVSATQTYAVFSKEETS